MQPGGPSRAPREAQTLRRTRPGGALLRPCSVAPRNRTRPRAVAPGAGVKRKRGLIADSVISNPRSTQLDGRRSVALARRESLTGTWAPPLQWLTIKNPCEGSQGYSLPRRSCATLPALKSSVGIRRACSGRSLRGAWRSRLRGNVQEIGKVLPAIFKGHMRRANPPLVEVLAPLWPRVVGKSIAARSQPVAFEAGTLTLATRSP